MTNAGNVPAKQNRLSELDGLRGIACLSVVIFHYSKYLFHNYKFGWEFIWGVTGVDLFFMISGFVIYMTLTKTEKVKDFAFSRFTRLYPIFWFAVCITALFCLAFKYQLETITIKGFVANLTMMPYILRSQFIDYSYWTLFVELQFYVVIAFFYFYSKKISVITKSLVLLGISVLFNVFSIYMNRGQGIILYLPLLMYWNLFLSGILFYKMKTENKVNWLYTAIILFNLLLVGFTHDQSGFTRLYMSAFAHVCCDVIYVALFYLLIYNKLKIFANPVFVFMGKISYVMYLIHQTIGYIIIDKFQALMHNNYASFALTVGIITLSSYIIFKYVEQPLMKKFRGKISLGFSGALTSDKKYGN